MKVCQRADHASHKQPHYPPQNLSVYIALVCSAVLSLSACDSEEDGTPLGMGGMEVAGIQAGVQMAGTPMAGAQMAGTQMAGMPVAGVQMAGVQMAGAQMAGTQVAGAQVAGAQMAGVQMAGAQMAGAQMAGTQMTPPDCSGATEETPCAMSIFSARRVDWVADLTPVQVEGVVTALRINDNGDASHIVVQDPLGGDYSGIWVYLNDSRLEALPILNRGESVRISGLVDDFYGQRQINTVTLIDQLGVAPPLVPLTVSPAEVSTMGARAASLEGALVQVLSVTVQDINPPPGPGDNAPINEFIVNGGLRIDDYLTSFALPMVGDSFGSITGVLRLGNGDYKLIPRDAIDLAR